jgi:large subunit ribosomal protein L17
MRHRKRTAKLGRTSTHRNAMLANMVCSLIKHKRVITTLAKAKAARSVAEKMVTLGKSGTLHDRRLAAARLHQEDAVKILFGEIAPTQKRAQRRLHPHHQASSPPGRCRRRSDPRMDRPQWRAH